MLTLLRPWEGPLTDGGNADPYHHLTSLSRLTLHADSLGVVVIGRRHQCQQSRIGIPRFLDRHGGMGPSGTGGLRAARWAAAS